MNQTTNIIIQQTFNGGARHLEILDDEKVVLRQRIGQQKSQHIISLLALAAKGDKTLAAKWYYLAIALVIPLILQIVLVTVDFNKTATISINLFSVVIFAAAIYSFARSISRTYSFVTRNAKIPVIVLNINNPDKTSFETFVNEIKTRINKVQENKNKFSANNLLAGEMRMLRRLESERLIDKKLYEKAKAKLLNQFGGEDESNN